MSFPIPYPTSLRSRSEGEREPKAVVQGKPVEGLSSLSSDGRWLAYVSTVTGGDLEVWVRSYPGPGTATRVSRNGGVEPVWGPGDEELYYLNLEGDKIMAVRVYTEPDFRFEAPTTLFEGGIRTSLKVRQHTT